MKDKEYCPNGCDIEFEQAVNSDIQSGNILISTWVEYCPHCLYINNTNVDISN